MKIPDRLRSSTVVLAVGTLLILIACQSSISIISSQTTPETTHKSNFTTQTGEKYIWSSVKIGGGGFVSGIVVHPTVPNLIYIRTDAGGAFRWLENEQRWQQLLSAETISQPISLNVESLAITPQNPNLLYLAAGAYTKANSGEPPFGQFLKSEDQGKSWQILPFSLPMGGNEWWRWTGERLAIDPNNSNIVYFGSRLNGLWHTEDGGKSWKQIDPQQLPLGKPHSETQNKAGVSFVIFDPKSGILEGKTKQIYAGVAGEGIYHSNDAGKTWQVLKKLSNSDLVPQQAVINSKGELFVTLYSREQDPQGAVWKFTAQEWQDITPSLKKNYSAITVNPQDSNSLFVATYPLTPTRIYRSQDGGKTWSKLNNNLDRISWWPTWSWWTLTGGIAIDPFHLNHLWLTTGLGVLKTENNRDQTVNWSVPINGVEETVTFDAIAPPGEASLITAIADFDGFRHQNLDVYPQTTHGNGEFITTTSLAYSANHPNFIVSVGASHHDPSRIRAGFSEDNGKTWQNFASITQKTHPPSLVFGNVAVSATDINNIVWQPSDNKPPYFTQDRGTTWQKIDAFEQPDIGGGAHTHLWNSQQILAADGVKGGTFYLYHHVKGRLFRSDDGGKTWKIVNDKLPGGVWQGARVKTVPGQAGEVWVSLQDQGLYYSRNFGQDFMKIPQVEESQTIGFGKAAPNRPNLTLFVHGKVANQSGVFRSTDSGKTWLRIADYPLGYWGNSRVLTGDMKVFGRVFLGTSGNGFIYGQPF